MRKREGGGRWHPLPPPLDGLSEAAAPFASLKRDLAGSEDSQQLGGRYLRGGGSRRRLSPKPPLAWLGSGADLIRTRFCESEDGAPAR